MIFRVKYFDKDVYDKDVYDYNHSTIHSNRLTHPKDFDFTYYFRISKDIEFSEYKVLVNNPVDRIFLIKANNEILFVDTFLYKKIWATEFKTDKSLEDNLDIIFRIDKSYNEYIYSFDSCIERIKVMGFESSWKEWLQVDKVLKRDIKIDNILKF